MTIRDLIFCDAPPWHVVHACQCIDTLVRPADVRWERWTGRRCVCNRRVGKLEEYTFSFMDGTEEKYRLGQCPRCKTMWWR